MHYPTERIAHTTAFVTPVVEHWLEREIAQWVYPMKDRSDDLSHHKQTLLPRSYISLSVVTDQGQGYWKRPPQPKIDTTSWCTYGIDIGQQPPQVAKFLD